jgi:Asp-tRNA(Asn)/Glu-tRNA(Gln) amidotransferase A subunit family amidase
MWRLEVTLLHLPEHNQIGELLAAFSDGRTSPWLAWRSYRERIERFEPLVRAFVTLDREAFGPHASKDVHAGPLAGVPFGVKDVIDVAGFATRGGSLSRADEPPKLADARFVNALRSAGATPVAKTVTTELAFVDPPQTRNPNRLTNSPGGSSSGSAAAVAAGFIPFALGTQTAGSLCRPAAYCGVAAIKPSFGLISTQGMLPLAPSFDTIGLMARRVDDASIVLRAVLNLPLPPPRSGKIGVLPPRFESASSAEIRAFHQVAIAALEAEGFQVEIAELDFEPSAVIADHRSVMLFEAAREHGHLLAKNPDLLGPMIRAGLAEGILIPDRTAWAARSRIEQARERVWSAVEHLDALLLQPAPDVAPLGFQSTGDQSYQTPWTAFQGPLVVVPGRFSSDGLPMAAMIAARPGADATAMAIASALEARLDRLPDYVVEPGFGSSAK